ncbi:MAG: 1,6-anhydro-N-acetylmuramyl-L-alanine amidase AmpD, partial [Methylophilaceae bacterium]
MKKSALQKLTINKTGIANQAKQIASPNFDARPHNCTISMVVIHNISLPPNEYGGNGIIELFTNRLNPDAHPYYAKIATAKVSSHFL